MFCCQYSSFLDASSDTLVLHHAETEHRVPSPLGLIHSVPRMDCLTNPQPWVALHVYHTVVVLCGRTAVVLRSVWQGMGEDGGLVAVKALTLPDQRWAVRSREVELFNCSSRFPLFSLSPVVFN